MTRLRGWITANLAVLAGAIVTGVHVGRAHGTGWGVVAGLLFGLTGAITLVGVVVWRELKNEGIVQ